MRFTNTVEIARPPRDVFEFVTDLENVPTWNHAIVETRKVSEGPSGVGTTYRQMRSLPSPSEETLRVTEMEPVRLFELKGDLGPFTGTMTYEFEPIEGGTRLTNTADLEARGLLRVAAPLAVNRVREAVASNLRTLRGILESAG